MVFDFWQKGLFIRAFTCSSLFFFCFEAVCGHVQSPVAGPGQGGGGHSPNRTRGEPPGHCRDYPPVRTGETKPSRGIRQDLREFFFKRFSLSLKQNVIIVVWCNYPPLHVEPPPPPPYRNRPQLSNRCATKSRYQSWAEVAEWYTAPCLLRAARTVMGSSLKPPPMLVDMSIGMWIKKAQLPCWPLSSQQVLHQRWIWGSHKRKSMKKGSILALKPRADVTRSPKVAPRKGLMSPCRNIRNFGLMWQYH